ILSIVTLAVFAGRIVYSQLGAYLLHEDLQERIALIADIAEHIAAAHATLPARTSEEESERVLAAQSTVHDRELPGLRFLSETIEGCSERWLDRTLGLREWFKQTRSYPW